MALLNTDVITNQALVLLLAVVVDDCVFLLDEGREIQIHLSRGETGIARVPSIVDDFRRANEVLGWQASSIDAGAPDRPCFCHHGALLQLLRRERGCERRRAGTENDEINAIRHGLRLPPGRVRQNRGPEASKSGEMCGDLGRLHLPGVEAHDTETVAQCDRSAIHAQESLQSQSRGRGTAPARHLRDVKPNGRRVRSLQDDLRGLRDCCLESPAAQRAQESRSRKSGGDEQPCLGR